MEDILEVYHRPRDPKRPLVCLDEKSLQLLQEVRPALPQAPGTPRREDPDYQRKGVMNLFMLFSPLEGWREVKVSERRTRQDFARVIRALVDEHFPAAEKVVLVLDNLNTHDPASLYEAFAPQEARRLCERLEIHHTPKHGSWLNMAEIELSVLERQCLDRRLPDADALARETAAWTKARNAKQTRADWQFTTEKARVKLKRLYPSIQE